MTQHDKTLVVGRTSSKCGRCGKGANPYEQIHENVIGYFAKDTPPQKGCGVEWKYITSDYMNGNGTEKAEAHSLRPDLRYIDQWLS